MRVLPGPVRKPISLAYLLARTTDTIADTDLVPVESRLEALRALRGRIMGEPGGALDWTLLQSQQALPAERVLLERHEESLRLLATLEEADQRRVREALAIIISGQELDLQRFGTASVKQIAALETWEELDDYTYRVAGCVGEFWTHVCRAHLFPTVEIDEKRLLAKGVLFGKGLQLVNVLRDLPQDLRKGRCYIPRALLARGGMRPEDLLDAASEPKFRAIYNPLLKEAESDLEAGWDYTRMLPRGRVQLGCAWPLLIGAGTLRRLYSENVLDAERRVKITRAERRSILWRSVLLYPWPSVWKGLLEQELKKGQPPAGRVNKIAAGANEGD